MILVSVNSQKPNMNKIVFCEYYNTNCSKILHIYGAKKCDLFLSGLRYSSEVVDKPIVITRIGLEILLLFQSELCDSLEISTKNSNYRIKKYSIDSFLQDFDKIAQNDVRFQLEVYSLSHSFDFRKLNRINAAEQSSFKKNLMLYCIFNYLCLSYILTC